MYAGHAQAELQQRERFALGLTDAEAEQRIEAYEQSSWQSGLRVCGL